MKTLVLYLYHEYHERVEYFIKHAIFLDPDVDFMIINNGSETDPEIPDYVMYFKGQNLGYDFGGWSRGLLYNDLYKEYDNFIFSNSSIMGPYLPSYFKGRWTDIYIDGLTDSVKLFGSTINAGAIFDEKDPEVTSHVQTYIFAVNLETLNFLISKEIFSLTKYSNTLIDAVINKELKMSRLIIENGWNIGCLMKYYKDVDFRFLASRPSDYKPFLDDVMYPKFFSDKFFQNFYELVFIKGNRLINNVQGIQV